MLGPVPLITLHRIGVYREKAPARVLPDSTRFQLGFNSDSTRFNSASTRLHSRASPRSGNGDVVFARARFPSVVKGGSDERCSTGEVSGSRTSCVQSPRCILSLIENVIPVRAPSHLLTPAQASTKRVLDIHPETHRYALPIFIGLPSETNKTSHAKTSRALRDSSVIVKVSSAASSLSAEI